MTNAIAINPLTFLALARAFPHLSFLETSFPPSLDINLTSHLLFPLSFHISHFTFPFQQHSQQNHTPALNSKFYKSNFINMEGLINDLNTREQSSFWQFSDQLRHQTSNFSALSLGDTIWSDTTSYYNKPATEDRRNVDVANSDWKSSFLPQKLAFGTTNNLDRYNTLNTIETGYSKNSTGIANKNNNNNNNDFNFNNNNFNGEIKSYFNKAVTKPIGNAIGNSKKNHNNNEGTGKKKNINNNNNGNNNSVDKRFKTLPPSEALPRNEAIGGYIFVCNNDTMEENLRRQLFGLPSRYRDSVRAIRPGLPLFLYNYSTHQLHGIFEAASFGGTNIDRTAWEDKKCPGESRFPAQVKVFTRKICNPLEEDAFRPILHHYDGPKFRLELSIPETIALLDIFEESNAYA
ncbi:DCD (Development and cell death) domain protein [Rhynchospora pubera]|uniref:DCD (Development and cell death) domain protein n=2 Tax=Rhynchospora pubera TaxID=906938 RepID=A0AAV8HSV0_9POAL|nr:DCD (Development and cell death) domain protein [Rhynchospora pubera]